MHPLYEKANAASADVFEAALEVQKHFGVGLPESLYQKCLARELQLRGHSAETEVVVPICYKGYEFQEKLRIDVLVDRCLVSRLGHSGIARVILKGAIRPMHKNASWPFSDSGVARPVIEEQFRGNYGSIRPSVVSRIGKRPLVACRVSDLRSLSILSHDFGTLTKNYRNERRFLR